MAAKKTPAKKAAPAKKVAAKTPTPPRRTDTQGRQGMGATAKPKPAREVGNIMTDDTLRLIKEMKRKGELKSVKSKAAMYGIAVPASVISDVVGGTALTNYAGKLLGGGKKKPTPKRGQSSLKKK